MKHSKSLDKIIKESIENDHTPYEKPLFFTPEHLLYNLIYYPVTYVIFKNSFTNLKYLRGAILHYIYEYVPVTQDSDNTTPFSVNLDEIFTEAEEIAQKRDQDEVTIFDLLTAIYQNSNSYCASILADQEFNSGIFIENIDRARDYGASSIHLWDRADDAVEKDLDKLYVDFQFVEENAEMEFEEFGKTSTALKKFTINLTNLYHEGKLNEVIGRTEETYRTLQILYRCTKNNVIYIGENGVGKSCLINSVVKAIEQGGAGSALKKSKVLSLNINALIAGTKYRGDLETRVEEIIKELNTLENPILFIDNIHQIFTVGNSNQGSTGNNFSDLLRGIIESENIRCIGTTTYEFYSKTFESDRAIASMFTRIDINEPTKAQTLDILKSVSKKFSQYHDVVYPDNALKTAIDLTSQYISDRRHPDKSIDVLDEAGAYIVLKRQTEKGFTANTVSKDIIKMITAKLSKVPLESVKKSEKDLLKSLEKTIKENVFGQDKAVNMLATAVKKARAGFRDANKCEASFLFVGPTGVGKTELAKVLSETLDEKLLRFDMSEYQEQYTVSRLIGSAPGYVGYENGGLLTDAVRNNPHSIILFDEIEKAHESIYNLLLQVLDYGTLTDNQGRKSDFRNCIIIFTSNAGARDLAKNTLGFELTNTVRDDSSSLNEAVAHTFSPEFRNRLDGIVPFSHLSRDITYSIAEKAIKKIGERLKSKKVELSYTTEACKVIAETGYSQEFGARNINRIAEHLVAEPLVDEVLFGSLSKGGKIEIKAENGSIVWQKK